MIDRLPRRVRHKVGEGAFGHLIRLAGRSGYDDALHFSRNMKLPFGWRIGSAIPELSRLSGTDPNKLASSSPRLDGRKIRYRGNTFPLYMFMTDRKYCPICLAEDIEFAFEGEDPKHAPYLRTKWSFTSLFGCTKHKVQLVHQCPSCLCTLAASLTTISQCSCGFDLTKAQTLALGDAEMRCLEWIEQRLEGGGAVNENTPHVMNSDLADLLQGLWYLGKTSIGGVSDEYVGRKMTRNNVREPLIRGFEMALVLPRSFERLLDKLSAGALATETVIPATIYGRSMTTWLSKKTVLTDYCRSILQTHVVNIAKESEIDWRDLSQSNESERRAQLDSTLLPGEQKRFEIAIARPLNDKSTRRDVITIAGKQGILITRHQAAEYFGLGPTFFSQMIAAGLVSPCWAAAAGIRDFYYLTELEELISSAVRHAPLLEDLDETMTTITGLATTLKRPAWKIMLDVCTGQLPVAGKLAGRQAMQKIALQKGAQPRELIEVPADLLTLLEVEQRLHIGSHALARLIKIGMIATVRIGNHKFVKEKDLLEFKSKFISASELADTLKLTYQYLPRHVDFSGLKHAAPGSGVSIFFREDVEIKLPVDLSQKYSHNFIKSDLMTSKNARIYLFINAALVRTLCHTGHLEGRVRKNKLYIPKSGIRDFRLKYISLKELATMLEVKPQAMRFLAEKVGLKSVLQDTGSPFFLREEAASALNRELSF